MIVAASSFYHSLKDLELEERKETQQKLYAVPGLSLNPNILNKGKNLRVFWNSNLWPVSRISSGTMCSTTANPPIALCVLAYLQSKRTQISAIVYCRRTSTPDIFEDLRRTEIIVIKTTGNLISRSKIQNPAVLREYLQVHQSSELELNSLRMVLSHRDHLPGNFSKIRTHTKKPSQGRCRAKARRAEVLAGDL